jgi:short-subunit dehydrogenase
MDLSSKVCVVTGASSGIGARIAVDLATKGAVVCAVARREDRLQALVGRLAGGPSRRHSYLVTDVSDETQVDALGREVRDRYGRCDVLVNNAGFSRGSVFEGEASLDDLEAVFRTNFFGAIRCTAVLLPLLEASAPSHVINIASVAGRIAYGGSSTYCASKFALVGWSEAAAFDLKKRGVHVGLIEPGPVPTEGFPQDALISHPVLRRGLASAGDVSRAVLRSIATSKRERMVPRYFYAFQFPKLFCPPLFRFVASKVVLSGTKRD